MPDRAAIVTGASRGIGRAIAQALAEDGYALTLAARKPGPLAEFADELTAGGHTVTQHAGNMSDEATVQAILHTHREAYGRLDLLVNSAGMGVGAAADAHQTKFVDMQLDVNLRSIILFYREALGLLKASGAETGQAWVINLASIAGKSPQPWLSVYSATKAAVLAYTVAMNKELGGDGIRSVALAPGFVDTDMSEFVKGTVAPEQMIQVADLVAAVRFVLSLSPACGISEIVLERHGEQV